MNIYSSNFISGNEVYKMKGCRFRLLSIVVPMYLSGVCHTGVPTSGRLKHQPQHYLCLALILSLKRCLSYLSSSLSTRFASSMSIPPLVPDSYSLARLETFSFAWSNTACNKDSCETVLPRY